MARTYRLGRARRVVNAVMSPLARVGLAGRHTYNLIVRGRKTRPYTVPVTLIEGNEQWLVAPYGEVGWVRNARTAGTVELSRAGRSETLRVGEVALSAPLRSSGAMSKACRWSAPPSTSPRAPSLADFIAEAPRHPIFRLDPDLTSTARNENPCPQPGP